jgi:hypothetical protein
MFHKAPCFILLSGFATLLLDCTNVADQPKTPIFEGTTEITLTTPLDSAALSGDFIYSAPADVKYLVFGLFDQQIVTSGKTISNPANFKYGNRDGLADFSRGTQAKAKLHNYNASTRDFDTTNATSPSGSNYYWAVWGFDQYGNLTHSSPQRKVTTF